MLNDLIQTYWYGDGKFLVIGVLVILAFVWMILEFENAELDPYDVRQADLDKHFDSIPRD